MKHLNSHKMLLTVLLSFIFSFSTLIKAHEKPDISTWPEASRKAAEDMINKYGEPDEFTESMLIWNNNGIWKKSIVYKEEVEHNFPMPHTDVLEQFVDLKVPPDKFDDLALYDGSVIVERTKGEISARCDKEAMNFLAINLAYDIINDEKTAEDARDFYAETAMAFMEGEKNEYTQELKFSSQQNTADADKKADKKM